MAEVSILIPTYNRANVLDRAIESVLNQTIDVSEIIIVDDGSTDNTEEVISKYEKDYNCIKYIAHDENYGQNHARNTGLKAATGEYISYLDSDDEFTSEHIEKVIECFDELSEEVGGVLTSFHTRLPNDELKSKIYSQGAVKVEDIADVNKKAPAHFSGLTIQKKILEDIGCHDTDVVRCADPDFFIQIISEYELFTLDQPLFIKHMDSNNRIGKNHDKIIEGRLKMLYKHEDKFNEVQMGTQYASIGKAYLNKGEGKKAEEWFLKLNEIDLPPEVYYQIGRTYIDIGDTNRARIYFRKALVNNSFNLKFIASYLLSFTTRNIFLSVANWRGLFRASNFFR